MNLDSIHEHESYLGFMQTLTEPVNLHNTSLRLDGDDLSPCDINPAVHPLVEQTCSCWTLHEAGPCLIVYGRGTQSEDTAHYLGKQCLAHNVRAEVKPIDEVNRDVPLAYFPGLVAVLPSQVINPTTDLQPFSHLIESYRARRPDGFASNRLRRRDWFYAGVVHLVGKPEIIQNSLMVAIQSFVCAQHSVDNSHPVDIFQLYTRPPISTQWTNEINSEKIQQLLNDVQAWGITKDDAQKALERINNLRNLYEQKSRYPTLHRPLRIGHESDSLNNAWNLNMLDIILDKKETDVEERIGKCVERMASKEKAKFRKTYKENGARVCRNAIEELRDIVPAVARPAQRKGKKDAQKDLRRLYLNLQVIDKHLNRQNGESSS